MKLTARSARSAVIGAAVLGLGAAACGTTTPTTTTTTATTPTTSTTPTTVAKQGLAVESSAYGSILATSSGKTLYEHSNDTANKSNCTGMCATVWPLFTVSAIPSLGAGVNTALLNRVGSTDQLSYGGHPLYTFSHDTAPHEANGEGINAFGGIWYVLSASTGKPVTAKVSGYAKGGTLPGG